MEKITKICTKCGTEKSLNEFYNDKYALDKKSKTCKTCKNKEYLAYIRTKHGLCVYIHKHQIRNSKARKHNPPTYSKEWLENWILNQPNFNELYNNWCKSGYQTLLIPSVDRKDDDIGYTIDNIQLMTWGENKRKNELQKKYGLKKADCKAIIQYDLSMNEISRYHSISEADRQTGIDFRNISAVLNGKRKTTGGFIWRFSD